MRTTPIKKAEADKLTKASLLFFSLVTILSIILN